MNGLNNKIILKKLTAIITSVIMTISVAFAMPQTAQQVYAADELPDTVSVSDKGIV